MIKQVDLEDKDEKQEKTSEKRILFIGGVFMKYKVSKLANNRSLVDISYNKLLRNFQIDVVEFGEGGKGSKTNATFFMQIDQLGLIADDIVNTRFKNNWVDDHKLYFIAGQTKARDISIEVKTGSKGFVLVFRIRNGEVKKGNQGQTNFDNTKEIKSAMTQQSLYDVRKMMKATLDFINGIPVKERYKFEE